MRARSSTTGPIVLQAEAVLGVEGLDWKLTIREANRSILCKYQYEILEFDDDIPRYLEDFWDSVDTDKEFKLGDIVTPGDAEPQGDDIVEKERQPTRRQRQTVADDSDEDLPRSPKRRKTNPHRRAQEDRDTRNIDVFEHHLPEHWRNFLLDEDTEDSSRVNPSHRSHSEHANDDEVERPPQRRRRSESVVLETDNDGDESYNLELVSAMEKRRNNALRRVEENRRKEILGQLDLIEARQRPAPLVAKPTRPIPVKERLTSGQYAPGSNSVTPARTLPPRPSVITYNKDAGGLVLQTYRALPERSTSEQSHEPSLDPTNEDEDLFGEGESIQPLAAEPDEELPDYEDTVEPEDPPELDHQSEWGSTPNLGAFGDAGLLQTNDIRRWVPPQPPAGYADPRAAAPLMKPGSQLRNPVLVDDVQAGFRFSLTFPLNISTIEDIAKPTFVIHLTDFSKLPPNSDRSLDKVLQGITKMMLFNVKSAADFRNRDTREPYSVGAGMCAKVEVPRADWYQKDRKHLAHIAEKLFKEGKYLIRRSQTRSVYLVFFPSSNIDMCQMLDVPKRLAGKHGMLIVSRVFLHHRP